jgi:hypothetical protein
MPLPKQQLPVFSAVIPSTKQKIKFRGFTVKEEKSLLLAQETDNIETILSTTKEVLSQCIDTDIDVNKLASFDIEYLMTQIRAKSVGEVIELSMPCDVNEDHRRTPVHVDVSKIEVKFPANHKTKIELYEGVGVVMKYPTVDNLVAFDNADGLESAAMCIDSIYTEDEVFDSKDQTKEEIIEFLESLTKKQFEKIENEFFKTMPVYEYEFDYKCSDCGHVHKKVIRGLANFFV